MLRRLEILEHEELACILRVLPIVGGVRHYIEGRLGVLVLILMCGADYPDLGGIGCLLVLLLFIDCA